MLLLAVQPFAHLDGTRNQKTYGKRKNERRRKDESLSRGKEQDCQKRVFREGHMDTRQNHQQINISHTPTFSLLLSLSSTHHSYYPLNKPIIHYFAFWEKQGAKCSYSAFVFLISAELNSDQNTLLILDV
ncbi:hypothetical protein L6452_07799 [Arctium lappa]|uniref:Uncharacterized protein n=1 Tax=Arctium lappa TaxID=4217 RepID=A0ACB9EL08_ARCLA|nr:hypothetical protein L6452_07799 [Arctium lappa]